MSFGSRAIRTLLAASTLHLMLAVPVRACPAETGAASPTAHQAATPMSHEGHHMASMPEHQQMPASEDLDGHGSSHMPCCPNPATACHPGACSVSTSATVVVVEALSTQLEAAAPAGVSATLWVSFAPSPEPPPPKA